MRIAVVGAGAVGCYFGGMLARAGHSVVLIARPKHVEAIRREGLSLNTRSFHEHVPLEASSSVDAVQGAEIVLLTVKSIDTDSAAAAMRPHLSQGAMVLSLQNGVDNAARVQAVLSQEVLATVVRVGAEMTGPGQVKHQGRGDLVIARSTQSTQIAQLFIGAGVPSVVSDDVHGELWAKLIGNCAYNAVSAITQLPYGLISSHPDMEGVLSGAVQEAITVAKAVGVTVPADLWATIKTAAQCMPLQYSSTAQDIARGKRSEIDHLNGYVVRMGDAHGIATPVNLTLLGLVKLLELRAAKPSAGPTSSSGFEVGPLSP